MALQDDLKRQEYIEACATVARLEAEWKWRENHQQRDKSAPKEVPLTREQVAEELNVSVSTVRKYEKRGHLQKIPGMDRAVRYTRAAVEKCKRRLE